MECPWTSPARSSSLGLWFWSFAFFFFGPTHEHITGILYHMPIHQRFGSDGRCDDRRKGEDPLIINYFCYILITVDRVALSCSDTPTIA